MIRVPGKAIPLAVGALAVLFPGPPTAHQNPVAEPAAVVAITGVTVIDGTGAPPLRDATVLVRDGRIEAVGPARSVRVPGEASKIDGTNKFLIPGLIDTHFHIAGRVGRPELDRILNAALAHGVTGIRDASGTGREEQLVQLRDRLEREPLTGPHLYVSGSATPQNLARYKSADLTALIRQLRDIGVDGIKLRNFRSEQALEAIRSGKSRTSFRLRPHVRSGPHG